MKRITPSRSHSSNPKGIFSPSKTLFSFGFKQSQSPGTPKVTQPSSENVGKSHANILNSLGAPDDFNGRNSGQKRDASVLQDVPSTQTKKPKISETKSGSLNAQEKNRTFNEIRLVLIRVTQVDTPLHTLCDLLYKSLFLGDIDYDFFKIEEGMTLGRQSVTTSNGTSTSDDKPSMNIGIPSDERVISREHVDIVSMEKGKNVLLPMPQHAFTADMKTQLYSFLFHAQAKLPKMRIRVNEGAKNSIRIHKRQIGSNLSTMVQNKEILERGQESILSVGDVIVFEASTKHKKNDYIYRLLAMECSSTNSISYQKLGLLQETIDNVTPVPQQTKAETSSDWRNQNENIPRPPKIVNISNEDSSKKKGTAMLNQVENQLVNVNMESSNILDTKEMGDSKKDDSSAIPNIFSSDNPVSIDPLHEQNKGTQTQTTTAGNAIASHTSDKKHKLNVSPKPAVGDRFRILFSVDDCFGRKQDIWHFGTSSSVKKKKNGIFTLDVELDDSTKVTVEYPDKDVERLSSEIRNDDAVPTSSSIVYALNQEGRPYQFAYDAQPKELFIGDLVLCHFQNGKSNNGWCHGRVAASDDVRKTFDVLYFDGEYEEGIPLVGGHVYLIERGKENPSWIVGLTLPASFYIPSSENVSTIAMCGPNLILNHPTRGDTEITQYDDLARILFLHHRASLKRDRILRWPFVVNSKPNKKYPYAVYSKSKVNLEHHKWVTGITDAEIQQDTIVTKDPFKFAEISPIHFANQVWRSINSSQPQNGFGILCHLVEVYHRFPTDMLRTNLQKFIVEGPKTDGVPIRDPNKTELVHRLTHYIANRCFDSNIRCNIYPRSWEDLQLILSLPFADGLANVDEMTDIALRRLRQSLQFANHSLNFISLLFLNELECSTEHICLPRVKELYRSKALVGYALSNGIRESLKQSLRSFIKCWVEYEKFRRSSYGSSNDVHRCLEEFEGCVRSLGAINSSLSWCYCAETGSGYGSKDCCVLYRDIIESEIRSSGLTFQDEETLSGLSQKDDLIFRIIFSLRTKFSVPLEENLAELVGLSGAYSLVFESLAD